MFRDVDLGICPGRVWDGDPARCVVVCPGAHPIAATTTVWPLLALLERGWSAVEYTDHPGADGDPEAWVRERVGVALARVEPGAEILLLAKSLGTYAAGLAAERGWPAVWLTPLLHRRRCVELLRARSAPALLVGGTADPAWDGGLARELGEVLELAGADHMLRTSDALASLDGLKRVCAAVAAFADSLPPPARG